MTLDEMYIETAMYTDEAITKTDGQYAGDSLKTVNKFKSALNYAYKKICREKFKLLYSEAVAVTDNKIDFEGLTKNIFQVKNIEDANGNILEYKFLDNSILINISGNVTIDYYYIPQELVNLTDVPLLPESSVDHKILCYFAAFQYLNIIDDDRAVKWLNLWNDGFNSIRQPNKIKRVKSVYDLGGYYD